MCEESRFLFLSRNQRDSREGQADPKGTCVHTCVRPVNIGRSYTKRIPSTLRGQFARCAHAFRDLARGATDATREDVISTSSLRFVMLHYAKDVFKGYPSDTMNAIHWYLEEESMVEFEHPFDIEVAVYYGNKKVFWYLHAFFGILPYEDEDIVIQYVLLPMIMYGRLNWIQDYLSRYPFFVKQIVEYPRCLVRLALYTCNASIVRYLVQKGAKIDGYDTNEMTEMLRNHMEEWDIYTKEAYEVEFKRLCSLLFPIVAELRAKYPRRVSEYATKHLIPDEELIDDDEELVSSDMDP